MIKLKKKILNRGQLWAKTKKIANKEMLKFKKIKAYFNKKLNLIMHFLKNCGCNKQNKSSLK